MVLILVVSSEDDHPMVSDNFRKQRRWWRDRIVD